MDIIEGVLFARLQSIQPTRVNIASTPQPCSTHPRLYLCSNPGSAPCSTCLQFRVMFHRHSSLSASLLCLCHDVFLFHSSLCIPVPLRFYSTSSYVPPPSTVLFHLFHIPVILVSYLCHPATQSVTLPSPCFYPATSAARSCICIRTRTRSRDTNRAATAENYTPTDCKATRTHVHTQGDIARSHATLAQHAKKCQPVTH